jgi:hypothetical protein
MSSPFTWKKWLQIVYLSDFSIILVYYTPFNLSIAFQKPYQQVGTNSKTKMIEKQNKTKQTNKQKNSPRTSSGREIRPLSPPINFNSFQLIACGSREKQTKFPFWFSDIGRG